MWLSVLTYDLVGLRSADQAISGAVLESIRTKRQELGAIDGAGSAILGDVQPEEIDPAATTHVIKRAWNSESSARDFADFADAASEFITSSVEEQG